MSCNTERLTSFLVSLILGMRYDTNYDSMISAHWPPPGFLAYSNLLSTFTVDLK